jgi:NAD(P)-dependent dehydrogenase (short-subunit alcohol dehydrogenase family)
MNTAANFQHLRAQHIFDVAGKSFVVTGAASGLGEAMAQVLSSNHAHVLLLDKDPTSLKQVHDRLEAAGGQVESQTVDVTNTPELKQHIANFIAKRQGLGGLFANAGVSGGPGFGTELGVVTGGIEAQNPAAWETLFRINLHGVISSMQSAVGIMKQQGRGSLVLTASITGVKAEPFVSYAYSTVKSSVVQLMRQAASELAPYGVRVNAIAPGFIQTNIADRRLHDSATAARLGARVPMGRLGRPDELHGVTLLLASDASSYMTGTLIPVDGGILNL